MEFRASIKLLCLFLLWGGELNARSFNCCDRCGVLINDTNTDTTFASRRYKSKQPQKEAEKEKEKLNIYFNTSSNAYKYRKNIFNFTKNTNIFHKNYFNMKYKNVFNNFNMKEKTVYNYNTSVHAPRKHKRKKHFRLRIRF